MNSNAAHFADWAFPLVMRSDALWQTAEANAIPYFKEVDALIRETMPKVFPYLDGEQSENPSEEGM